MTNTQTYNPETPTLSSNSNLEIMPDPSAPVTHIEVTDNSSPEAAIQVTAQHLGEVAVEEPK